MKKSCLTVKVALSMVGLFLLRTHPVHARRSAPEQFEGATLLVFCAAEDNERNKELCNRVPPIAPSVFKNVEYVSIPREKFNTREFKSFLCEKMGDMKSKKPLIPLITGHGLGDAVDGGWRMFWGESEAGSEFFLNSVEITSAFAQCQKENDVPAPLLIDSCHSGGACLDLDKSKFDFSGALAGVVSSCSPGQACTAQGLNQLLLNAKKICREVDRDQDGIVTVQELAHFRQKNSNWLGDQAKSEKRHPIENAKPEASKLPTGSPPSVTRFSQKGAGAESMVPLFVGRADRIPLMTCESPAMPDAPPHVRSSPPRTTLHPPNDGTGKDH